MKWSNKKGACLRQQANSRKTRQKKSESSKRRTWRTTIQNSPLSKPNMRTSDMTETTSVSFICNYDGPRAYHRLPRECEVPEQVANGRPRGKHAGLQRQHLQHARQKANSNKSLSTPGDRAGCGVTPTWGGAEEARYDCEWERSVQGASEEQVRPELVLNCSGSISLATGRAWIYGQGNEGLTHRGSLCVHCAADTY